MPVFLFDRDPLTGAVETFEYDEANDHAVIHRREDVEPLIEHNKRLYTEDDAGWSPTREMRRVASIPNGVILEWRQRYGIDVHNRNHWPAVKRLLNDSEWLYLRTAPGRV